MPVIRHMAVDGRYGHQDEKRMRTPDFPQSYAQAPEATSARASVGAGLVEITSERLRLRPHALDDLDDCISLWSDPDVVRHIGGKPSTREEVWQRLLRYAGHWSLMNFGFWAIRDAVTDRFLGDIGLADFKRELDPSFASWPECGWALLPSAHGKGYAAEALRAVLGWADTNLEADRVVCLIDPANRPSIQLAERCGFARFGISDYWGAQSWLFERRRPQADR